jgi:hypothetical protein
MVDYNLTPFTLSNITVPVQEPKIVTVHQISLFGVILYFLIYLAVHIMLGVMRDNLNKQINRTEEDEKSLNFLKIAFKWWPFVYLFIIILTNI